MENKKGSIAQLPTQSYNFLIKSGWAPNAVVRFLRGSMIKTLPFLVIKDVSVNVGPSQVLSNISFEIRKGDILGIVGKAGSGKSTLLKALIGVQPCKGEVRVKNAENKDFVDLLKDKELLKTYFGISTQEPSVYQELTVRENLEHFAGLYGFSKEKIISQVEMLLNLLGLSDKQNRIVEGLERSAQKKLDIACALINDPMILLLDNPTAGLDSFSQKRVHDILKRLQQRGMTILVVSNRFSEIEELCSRVAILNNGKLAEYGTPAELKQRLHLDYFEVKLRLHNKIPSGIVEILKQAGVKDVHLHGNYLSGKTYDPEVALQKLSQHLEPHILDQFDIAHPSFNDVLKNILHHASPEPSKE